MGLPDFWLCANVVTAQAARDIDRIDRIFGFGCRLFCTPQGENPVHPVNPVQVSAQGKQLPNVIVYGILAGLGLSVNCAGNITSQGSLHHKAVPNRRSNCLLSACFALFAFFEVQKIGQILELLFVWRQVINGGILCVIT